MLNRRTFLAGAASVAAARAIPAPDRRKLREFPYSQVTLASGPLADHYRRVHAHFLSLDEDRILKIYRQRAGLPAPGRDMGGWYDAAGFVPGHLIGQFISGLSRIFAHTGDRDAAAKARRLVEGYTACFDADGNPYAHPKASTTWPCYVLDKYEIGLLDAAALAGIDSARALLPRVIDAGLRFIPDHVYDRTPDSPKQAPYDEPYILPENLFKTAEFTGDPRFTKLARTYLLDDAFFNPLADGRNILPGKHGYSHLICLSSGAKAYEVLGDEKYLRALRNAWDMLETTQQYASGGSAPKEAFVEPDRGMLAASLASTRDHFETPCGYYAHSKLARALLGFTGDSRYGDGLERVLYNTILGAIDPDNDGGYFYYSDYHALAHKGYYKQRWPCCAGTLVQSVADYPLNLYFWDDTGVYVNLYATSEVRWKSVRIAQRTTYPESGSVELRIDSPAEFSLRLRIPGWLTAPAQIRVNGTPAGVKTDPGTFATLHRQWKRNDTVELTLPLAYRTVPIDNRTPNVVALMRGPLLMAAVDPPDDLVLPSTLPGPLTLRPWYQVQRETYSTYFGK
jgi:DUF1680 family protein